MPDIRKPTLPNMEAMLLGLCEYGEPEVIEERDALRVKLARVIALAVAISRYADGHELQGKWAAELVDLKNELHSIAAEFK